MRGNYCKSFCDSRFVHSLCCSDKMNNLWFMILCVQVYVCVSVILCMCVSPFEATRACMKHSKVDGGGGWGHPPETHCHVGILKFIYLKEGKTNLKVGKIPPFPHQ